MTPPGRCISAGDPSLADTVMTYDMVHFGNMLRDRRRRGAYVAALEAAVGPESVVLDLGAGPGFFAAVAARLGARQVYAVDLLGAVDAVPLLAKVNGMDGRLTAFRGDIQSLELPEQPDVIVADLRGILPLHTSGLGLVADVREQVMAPNGTWLQERDHLRAALACVDRASLEDAWDEPGLDLDMLRRLTLSVPRRVQLEPEQLLSTSGVWSSIDYTDHDDLRSTRRRGTCELNALADGVANSVALWFDAELIDDVRYTSGPGDDYTTYGQFNLPLVDPLPVHRGEAITVSVGFNRLDGGDIWRWSVDGACGHREGSSLDSIPMSPAGSPPREEDGAYD